MFLDLHTLKWYPYFLDFATSKNSTDGTHTS